MKSKTVLRLFKYLKKYWAMLIFAFCTALLNVTFTLLAPVFAGKAIDNIVAKGNVNFAVVTKFVLIMAGSIVLAVIFQWITSVVTQKIATYTSRDLRTRAFEKICDAPMGYIYDKNYGDIISRLVLDADFISEGIAQTLTQLIPGIVTIIGTLVIMMILNPVIALVVFLVTPISILFAGYVVKKCRQSFLKKAKTEGDISSFINETVSNHILITAFNNQHEYSEKFKVLTNALFKTGVKAQFYSSITNPGTRFVNSLVYALVIIIGAFSVLGKTFISLSIGDLSAFLIYANQYTKPFNEISGVVTQLQTALVSAERLFEICDAPEEKKDAENAVDMPQVKGDILFKDVHFSYVKDKPLIKGFNLDVKSGQKIAIVGPTGCGKTTLINLLMRFYDTTSGEITLDGVNIADIKRGSLRQKFGMVLQETWLEQTTVRENIAYARQDASLEEVIQAAKACYAHSFIMQLEHGYDTVLTEGARNLSEGQKQLLCIARMMLAQPQILILDEATSSIDTRTEALIGKAFDKVMKDKTSFVVAHRLSTIQSADVILVLKDGNIIEQGNHNELLEHGGFYKKLYYSQFSNN